MPAFEIIGFFRQISEMLVPPSIGRHGGNITPNVVFGPLRRLYAGLRANSRLRKVQRFGRTAKASMFGHNHRILPMTKIEGEIRHGLFGAITLGPRHSSFSCKA